MVTCRLGSAEAGARRGWSAATSAGTVESVEMRMVKKEEVPAAVARGTLAICAGAGAGGRDGPSETDGSQNVYRWLRKAHFVTCNETPAESLSDDGPGA
jgi:hypothetical protein